MHFSRHGAKLKVLSLATLFLLSFSTCSIWPNGVARAQSCNFTSASLNPRGVFQNQINSYAQNILNLPLARVQINPTVNSANLLQNAQVTFTGLSGRATGTFFNLNLGANFPPQTTANLPRPAFNPLGTLAFYTFAGPLSTTQLQSVQALYAADLTSRRNYALNVANLARHFTALQGAGANANAVNFALNSLRTAYNTLSNPTAAAPDPRRLYRDVTVAYVLLLAGTAATRNPATITQAQLEQDLQTVANNNAANTAPIGQTGLRTGVNILAIGLSNYDTNRLPVNGTSSPTATGCAGCFPLPAFDNVRAQALTQAQARPDLVFGDNGQPVSQINPTNDLTKYLYRILGFPRTSASPFFRTAADINYQVNSADQIQFAFVPVGNANDLFTLWFVRGFGPTFANGSAATLPEFALTTASANQYVTLVGEDPINTRFNLANFYSNAANAARLNNYLTNLRNLNCALTQLRNSGGLTSQQTTALNNAINVVNVNIQSPNGGAIFSVYSQVETALNTVAQQPVPAGQPTELLRTLQGSLLPIGIINYYIVPATIGI
jgi:hypothetical protein